jgi:molybdopterin converting factor small subunit
MVKISILFFAILKEKTGVSRIEIELPEELTVADLKIYLAEKFPAIQSFLQSVITSGFFPTGKWREWFSYHHCCY